MNPLRFSDICNHYIFLTVYFVFIKLNDLLSKNAVPCFRETYEKNVKKVNIEIEQYLQKNHSNVIIWNSHLHLQNAMKGACEKACHFSKRYVVFICSKAQNMKFLRFLLML